MIGEGISGRMARSFVALLTVVAFHRVISGMMPRLPYMTFLDGMILIAYLFTCITIIEIVVVNYFRATERDAIGDSIDVHARWAVPLAFVGMVGLMWAVFLL